MSPLNRVGVGRWRRARKRLRAPFPHGTNTWTCLKGISTIVVMFRFTFYIARLLTFILFTLKLSTIFHGAIYQILQPFLTDDSRSQHAGYASALKVEYSGLDQLLHDTQFLPALSHDLAIGVIAIEDLLKIVKSSALDGADVLADNMELLRSEAKSTAQNLHGLQVKVDGLIDR